MEIRITGLRNIPRHISPENLEDLTEHLKQGMLVQDFEGNINIGYPYGIGSITGIGGIHFRVPYSHQKQHDPQMLERVRVLADKRGLEMEPIMRYIDETTSSEVQFYRLKKHEVTSNVKKYFVL
jgi:hypothetical protein